MIIRNEARIAAGWWADQLRQTPEHDAGDPTLNAFHSLAAKRIDRPSPEQIEIFERSLQIAIERRLSTGAWNPDNPAWGGYHRVVATDYGPDHVLAEALEVAGIKSGLVLPIKTVMWIDPGEVKVARGYRAQAEVVASSPDELPETNSQASALNG